MRQAPNKVKSGVNHGCHAVYGPFGGPCSPLMLAAGPGHGATAATDRQGGILDGRLAAGHPRHDRCRPRADRGHVGLRDHDAAQPRGGRHPHPHRDAERRAFGSGCPSGPCTWPATSSTMPGSISGSPPSADPAGRGDRHRVHHAAVDRHPRGGLPGRAHVWLQDRRLDHWICWRFDDREARLTCSAGAIPWRLAPPCSSPAR